MGGFIDRLSYGTLKHEEIAFHLHSGTTLDPETHIIPSSLIMQSYMNAFD